MESEFPVPFSFEPTTGSLPESINSELWPQILLFEECRYYPPIYTDTQLLSNVEVFNQKCRAILMFLLHATYLPYFILVRSTFLQF
jgi:hypothetical protein